MYNVWVCLQKEYGWVLTANCSCMAGLGSVFSHVAALLFKIESASHLKLTEGISPAPIKLINFSRPRKHQLPKEIAQEPLKRRNFSTKNRFLGTHPLTNDELKKLHQENPASAIFTSIDPSCFHEYSNSDESFNRFFLRK